MARPRRRFTTEFKLEAVRLAEGGQAPSVVARELGIRSDMLRKWRRQFATAGRLRTARHPAGPARPLMSQDEEIRQLRREVAQRREERDILKKATAFFARASR